MALLPLNDSLELIVKRREFLPGCRFLSHRDMPLTVESDLKSYEFLPSQPREFCRLRNTVCCPFSGYIQGE